MLTFHDTQHKQVLADQGDTRRPSPERCVDHRALHHNDSENRSDVDTEPSGSDAGFTNEHLFNDNVRPTTLGMAATSSKRCDNRESDDNDDDDDDNDNNNNMVHNGGHDDNHDNHDNHYLDTGDRGSVGTDKGSDRDNCDLGRSTSYHDDSFSKNKDGDSEDTSSQSTVADDTLYHKSLWVRTE